MLFRSKTAQIYGAIQTGAKLGMKTLEMVLSDLYQAGTISFEQAMGKSSRADELQRLINAGGTAGGANRGQAQRGRSTTGLRR